MKKNWLVKFIFVFALLLAFSPAAFAAAPNAANADADVEGLWLTCPAFPADAEVLKFEHDTDMDMFEKETDTDTDMDTVIYTRSLDNGLLTFQIMRGPIAESELQSPEDVADLIEMRVYNDDIDEEAIEENMNSIDVTENAEELAALLSYPCSAAEYTTGTGETTRQNISLFVFTDVYRFQVDISMAADSAEDYAIGPMQEWLQSLELVDSGSGGEADEAAADAEVTGMWLEMPAFPKDAAGNIDISDDQVVYARALEDGAFTLVISRIANPDNVITPELVGMFISEFSGVSEDDLEINVPEPDDEPIFPLAGEYPFASAEYESEDEGVTKQNMDFFFFPDENLFWVHMEVTDEDVMEKYDLESWFRGIRIVER